MSNFGIFKMPALQIWPCHVTQEVNFEKILPFPNSAFNIRKSYKMSSRKALYFRSYQPKTLWGVEFPSAFRVKVILRVDYELGVLMLSDVLHRFAKHRVVHKLKEILFDIVL